MSASTTGLLVGLLLTLAVTTGGLLGLLLAIVLGAGGWLVGSRVTDDLDIEGLLRGRRG